VLRRPNSWSEALRWLLIGLVIVAAMVLAAGNSAGW
jgi:hypothetical protein